MTTPTLPTDVLDLYGSLLRAPDEVDTIVESSCALEGSGTLRPIGASSVHVASTGGPNSLVLADSDGFVQYDLDRIRDLLLAPQADTGSQPGGGLAYPDASSVRLLSAPRQDLRRGDPALDFRAASSVVHSTLRELFTVRSTAAKNPNKIMEIVGP